MISSANGVVNANTDHSHKRAIIIHSFGVLHKHAFLVVFALFFGFGRLKFYCFYICFGSFAAIP